MQQLHIIIALFITITVVANDCCVFAIDYLKEAPAFLKPCRLDDSQRDACLSKSIESIFVNWSDGIPGLKKSVGSLEPFRVRKVRIEQHLPNVEVQAELRNMTTHGLSRAKVLNSTTIVNSEEYRMAFHIQMSRIVIETKYKLNGQVLVLRLNSTGSMRAELEDLEYYVAMKMHSKTIDGIKFLKIDAVKTDIARIDNVRVHFTNLFGGNELLEQSANDLFNENWRVLFELLRPVLTQTYDSVLLNRFEKIFSFVPAKLLYEDI